MKIEKDKRTTECTHLLLLRNWPLDGESIQFSSYERGKGNSLNRIKSGNWYLLGLCNASDFLLLLLGLFCLFVSRAMAKPLARLFTRT